MQVKLAEQAGVGERRLPSGRRSILPLTERQGRPSQAQRLLEVSSSSLWRPPQLGVSGSRRSGMREDRPTSPAACSVTENARI
ncbi:hypothetical protein MRX96_012515 [Rhipicephalus microplus]